MRKMICLLLAIALLLSGCGGASLKTPGNFYYRLSDIAYNSADGVIAPEVRELDGLTEDPEALMEVYLKGPESRELESPFPRNTTLEEWSMEDTTMTLTLSREFSSLSGLDLTIACACITRTLLELTPATTVVIQTTDSRLDNNVHVTMSDDLMLLVDDSLEKLRTTITVYYADQDWRYLIGQEISVNLAAEDDVCAYLMEQLASPPDGSGLLSALPRNTQLLDATVADGLCTLDFSQEFVSNGWNDNEAQRLTLLSIVNTLTQLDTIDQVEFSVEGDLLAQYRQLAIAEPLTADESAIGPVRTSANEFDATLYLSNGPGSNLTAIPARIRQNVAASQPELVLQALLEYRSTNGFYSTIPAETQLVEVSTVGTICRVRLSKEFVSSSTHIPASVKAIVLSLCALEDVERVQVIVEGYDTGGEYDGYFELLTPNDEILQ